MNDTPPPQPATSLRPARAFPWFAWSLLAVLAIALILAGLALAYRNPNGGDLGAVNEIRITAKPGIDLSKIEEILDTPDYYLEVWTPQGKQRTKTFKDTRVGNGLTFQLPVPLRLVDIKEIKVFDENVMKDDLVDRIDRPARDVAGEKFQFQLTGPPPAQTQDGTIGWGMVAVGGAVLLLAVVRFLWTHVV